MSRQNPSSPTADQSSPPGKTAHTTTAAMSTNPSFAERKARNPEATTSPTPHLVDGNRIMRDIDRPPPGDVIRRARKAPSKPDLEKRRSNINFFEEAFSTTETSPAKERVYGDSMVMAEVKTNVIVRRTLHHVVLCSK